MEIRPIAYIKTEFPEKFGIPRQSGLVEGLFGKIVFMPEFRNPEALRGLQGFSHIWLLWEFEEVKRDKFVPTVRPPRLGGNIRMGVFATRSPFRPNPIGLSCVKLTDIEYDEKEGPIIIVEGADLRDNTPIFDIKPYIPYADCLEEASGGFTDETFEKNMEVSFPDDLLDKLPENKRGTVMSLLKQDPRVTYKKRDGDVCGMLYAGYNIRFVTYDNVIEVVEVEDCNGNMI